MVHFDTGAVGCVLTALSVDSFDCRARFLAKACSIEFTDVCSIEMTECLGYRQVVIKTRAGAKRSLSSIKLSYQKC